MVGDTFGSIGNTARMLTDADFKFQPAVGLGGEELPVTQGTYETLRASADREARRTAWESFYDQHLAYKNTLSSNLQASIKANVFQMNARRHETTLGASLFENNIPVSVFHNLIDTFKANLPTWHRYWHIRRKALGVDTLHPYDIWAPLTDTPADVSYEQAVEWICDGLAPLGTNYVETVRRGCLEERWVDVYPNEGKSQGAFSWGTPDTYPFILTSFNDNVFALSTLAHELGHSMHSYLTWQTQPFVYSDYSLFVAEVASNFHQALVRAHLLKTNADPIFQINVIEEAMSNFHRYFLIMPTLARFELEMHEKVEQGEGLTADSMIARMAELFSEAYGDEMHVDQERVGIVWATFGHLYADYYVYQYATGISGANALANRVLREGEDAVDAYLNFLKTGGALYPLDALKLAGVDLTSPAPVEEAFAVLAGLVDRLEELVG
jgi:oligoendopeptidase F